MGTVLAVAATLALCVSDVAGGPDAVRGDALALGGDHGALCILAGATDDVAYGFETLENLSDDEVVVRGISVVSPTRMTVVDAYLAAIGPGAELVAVGAMPNWPLTADQVRDVPSWRLSPAQGLSLPSANSDGGGLQYNIVVHLTATGPLPAGFDAVRVAYTRNGRDFVQEGTTAFRLARETC